MDRELIINRILRDMKMSGLITTDEYGDIRSGEARMFLNALCTAAEEMKAKDLSAHNKKKVIKYNQEGQPIAEYLSIADAASAHKCSRDVIDASVSGRTQMTRKGYYFRYAS